MNLFKKNLKFEDRKHRNNSQSKIREWFVKWDRTIAAVTAVIIFFLLLAFVIVNIKIYNSDDSKDADENSLTRALIQDRLYKFLKNYFKTDSASNNEKSLFSAATLVGSSSDQRCSFVTHDSLQCSNVDGSDLIKMINEFITKTEKASVTELRLNQTQFKNNRIKQGWLNGLLLKFTSLTITDSTLSLEDSAFAGPPFESLQELHLLELHITNLRKETFKDSHITKLEITCKSRPVIEENVFGELANTLTELQMLKYITSDMLENITGSASEPLLSLTTLDLRFNMLQILKATSFENAPNLESLYLGHSNIGEIEAGVFNNQRLCQLDLSNNYLKTLPEHIFDEQKGIVIVGNTFVCNCSLDWLRILVDNDDVSDQFSNKLFECYENYDKGQSVSYKSVTFCPSNNTTTISSTMVSESTPIMSSTTITPPTTTTPLSYWKCLQLKLSSLDDDTDPLMHLAVRRESIQIYIQSKDAHYTLAISGDNAASKNILWINAINKSDRYCLKNLSTEVRYDIDELKNGETYIFCAMSSDTDAVSPLDCAATTVPLLSKDLPFITNEYKVHIISAICGSLLLAILISGVIVFFCIRQHPGLIRGNKRVIIVKSEAADAIVMPKTYYYEEIRYKPPSLNSGSNGYLTPKNNVAYRNNRRCSSNVRTISENTPFVIPSTSGIVVPPGCMTRTRKSHYRRRTKLEHVTHAFDEHLYEDEPPPPLPPNHPLGLVYTDSLNRTYSHV